MKKEAGLPESIPLEPQTMPATKTKAKGKSQAAPTPSGSPPAAAGKLATPDAAAGTKGKGDAKLGAAKPAAAAEAHLSRAEAAKEAKKALESLALPNKNNKLGPQLELTR